MSLESRILFNNNSCLVVNKLAGEAVEGAKDGIINLPDELLKTLNATNKGKYKFIEAVNRLDVPVTGCALFALEKDALVFLNNTFAEENNLIEKKYWAIIEKPSNSIPESAKLIHWIEVNKKLNKSIAHNTKTAGTKKASLKYRITGQGDNYLFLEIELHSGRHHQIRAQLAAMGMFIKGDLKYGAKRSEKGGGIRLHARSLTFPNPLNKNEKIVVTADPPLLDNLWKAYYEEIYRELR